MYKHLIFFFICIAFSCSCSNKEGEADAYGNFESEEYIVSSELNGKLVSFDIEEGNYVEKDQIVGLIDTTDLFLKKKQIISKIRVVSSQAANVFSQIDVYKQQLKTLEVEKNRIEKMLNDGAATQQQLDQINGNIDVIQEQIASVKTKNASVVGEVNVLKEQLKEVEHNILKSFIRSPINGTVLGCYVKQHELALIGKALFKVADINTMYLKAYVSENQLANIKLGQEVTVSIDSNNELKHYKGTVSWISEEAEFTPKIVQTKEERINLVYAIKVKVKNDGSIKIGMPGELGF